MIPAKTTAEIQLLVTRENLDPAVPDDKKIETLEVTLADKLDDLLLRVGYSNAQVLNMTLQLMTVGKIRVEFDNFNERMELVDKASTMTRPEAISMFDEHLALLQGNQTAEAAPANIGATQKIVITPRQKPAPQASPLKRIANVAPPGSPGMQIPAQPQVAQQPYAQQPYAQQPQQTPAWQQPAAQAPAYMQPQAQHVQAHPQFAQPQAFYPATPTQVLQTMARPKKKENSALIWILIVVVIVVGAGIGVALVMATKH